MTNSLETLLSYRYISNVSKYQIVWRENRLFKHTCKRSGDWDYVCGQIFSLIRLIQKSPNAFKFFSFLSAISEGSRSRGISTLPTSGSIELIWIVTPPVKHAAVRTPLTFLFVPNELKEFKSVRSQEGVFYVRADQTFREEFYSSQVSLLPVHNRCSR